MPIDATIERESDPEYEVVALASVMSAASNARIGPTCGRGPDGRFAIHVSGAVAGCWGGADQWHCGPSGQLTFKHVRSNERGATYSIRSPLKGSSGSVTFIHPGTACRGTLTPQRG